MTRTARNEHRYGRGQVEIVEAYWVRKDLAAGLKRLAGGEKVNGDTTYGVHNVRKEGRWWYADWALEVYAEDDPNSHEFSEKMAGHIRWDLSTILNMPDWHFDVNWRGLNDGK
jgi:hypothetical protein